jgi:hypothetical protein
LEIHCNNFDMPSSNYLIYNNNLKLFRINENCDLFNESKLFSNLLLTDKYFLNFHHYDISIL